MGPESVLGGVSEAELDAIVGKLRTDKNRIVPVATESRSRWEQRSEERLHKSRPRVSSALREEVAGQSWYVGLGDKASGPHDLEALKGYWERGELGPDSLCWREGFSDWTPLCQVPGLAEALAPLPQERVPEPEQVPTGDSAAPASFSLKGAEALRVLAEEEDPFPELDLEAARVDLSAPISTREPVLDAAGFMDPRLPGSGFIEVGADTAGPVGAGSSEVGMGTDAARFAQGMSTGAAGPLGVHGAGLDELGRHVADPVGTHAVLAASREDRGGGRWRSALWLAILGGVSGGVTVAAVLALLGSADGRALLARMGVRDAVQAVGSGSVVAGTPGGAMPGTVANAAPGAVGAGTVPGAGVNAQPGAVGTGMVPGAGVNAQPGAVGAGMVPGAGVNVQPGAVGAGAVPGAGVAALPGAMAQGAVQGTAQSGAVGTGAVPGASSTAPGGVAGSSLAGAAAGVDRGGSVPVLTVAQGSVAPPASKGPSAPKTELATVSPPTRAPVARASVPASALALEKRSSETPAPPVTETSFESEVDDLGLDSAPAAEEKPSAPLGPDEDFDRELAEPPAGAGGGLKERTVYVPPDPSKGPASLAQSDIFEVVLANKGDITACAREQQAGPKEGGRVVVRWSILPSGKVDEVATETASIQGTPLARCIEAKVRAWTFPKHQEQGGPVRFPFVF